MQKLLSGEVNMENKNTTSIVPVCTCERGEAHTANDELDSKM